MLQPFVTSNGLMGYADGTVPCPGKTLPAPTITMATPATLPSPRENPNYQHWVSNDSHVRMLLISTISEASFRHVHRATAKDLWIALEKAYAPHTSSREYTLKTQLPKIEMKGDESTTDYPNRA